MAQVIKVHKIVGLDGREETTELKLQETQKLVENCNKWNCLVYNTKTREVISEVTPGVDEITIYFSPIRGG